MLKPGNLPTDTSTANFDDSLGKAIEDQLNYLLGLDHIDPLPTDNSPETRDRRIRESISLLAAGKKLGLK